MSEEEQDSKIKFVEKMKRDNPRAFNFLARGAADLLKKIEEDKEKEGKEVKEE